MGEELLGTTQSYRQARRLLDELAIQGGWELVTQDPIPSTDEWSVLYQKGDEELTLVKRGPRTWDVVKRRKVENVKVV